MATLRKYDKERERWDGIASNDASGVYSDNPDLTGDETGNVVSVEDILLRYRADIARLQRNVSWLAKHGGGGSGGSGGGGVKATLSVLDPTDGDVSEITSLVWSNDITHLSYKLVSNTKTTFTITVKLNNSIIQVDTINAKNYTGSISMSGIKKYIGTGGTLSIVAVDASESEFSTNCKLIISNVILNDSSIRLTKEQLESHESNKLSITCRSNVLGHYKLYYSNSMIYVSGDEVYSYDENGNKINLDGSGTEDGQFISVNLIDTNLTRINIDVVEQGLISVEANPGTYNRYFLLMLEGNPLVRSSVAGSQIIVIVTEGLLVSPQTGSMTNPYTISIDNILPLQFTVFSNNEGTYSYSITIADHQIGTTVSGALPNTQITYPINLSNYSSFLVEGEEYEVEILAFQGLVRETGKTKIKILRSSAHLPSKYLEDIDPHTIFDFTYYKEAQSTYTNSNYSDRLNNNRPITITSTNTLNNIGADSGSNSVYYSFRHTAYGEIVTNSDRHWFANTTQDTNCFIPKSNFQFTLQIAYHIEEEEDDYATILNLGTYNPDDNTGHGILITSHKLYIALEDTTLSEDLQDNDFTQLDIVSESSLDGKYWLKVYQNSKLLSSTEFKLDDKGTSGSQNLRKFFIGCKSINSSNGLTVDSINLDLYSIKFYSKALNVGQIVCSYINNFANFNRTSEGLPSELITSMCDNNQIAVGEREAEIVETSEISPIYDFKEGKYTWNIGAIGNNITLPDSIKKLPIPVVTLSVADAGWDFDGFINGAFNNSPATNCPFTYKSGRGNRTDSVSDLTVESTVTVSIQGTTSASYSIKNLNITFPDDVLFSPINTWFPEHTFTLKADIVDSGHINNAVIGKFVNDCFNDTTINNSLMNITGCFPTVSKVNELKSSEKLPPNLTVKATIEGFPVLLVVNFKLGDQRDVRILGIYSFNLGRESYYNQGYKVPKHLYSTDGRPYTTMSEITFPALFGEPPITDTDISNPGFCFEGQASHNCSTVKVPFSTQQYDYAVIDKKMYYPALETTQDNKAKYGNKVLVDDTGKEIPFVESRIEKYKVNPDGYFWSKHETYTSSLWKFVADPSILRLEDAEEAFRALNIDIATKIPYRKGTISQSYGSQVEEYSISAQGETIHTEKTGSSFTLRAAQSDAETTLLSIKNTSFYYVVSMLFGLVDSLGKNLQMKYWGGTSGGSSFWSPTFYDMDTALGIDNTGKVSIKPNVLDYAIFNTQENKAQPMFGQLPKDQTDISLYTVYSNKLWGIENPDFVRQYAQDFNVVSSGDNPNANFFAQMWHNLRTTVLKDSDEFFEVYFAHQFDGCGEFLVNYDYQVKYLDTSEVSYLHGNRLSFIKNWLEKRITFLDSIFGFSQRIQNNVDYSLSSYLESPGNSDVQAINAYNVPWKNQVMIKHNSGLITLPIKTNRAVIMKVTVGGVNTSYTYVPDNKETEIIVSEGIGTMGIQTNINNSSCITSIKKLSTLDITELTPRPLTTVYDSSGNEKYRDNSNGNLRNQWGSFASLKELDLAGSRSFYSNIDFFRLFKTWDTSVLNGPLGSIDPNYFSLHTLDLSNMNTGANLSVNLGGESYPIIPEPYTKPFINLSSVNLSNSDVSNIDIPSDVSLSYLNLVNSRVSKLTLSNQPLLKTISFTGCKNLSELRLINCEFTNITFDNSNVSLSNITISGCKNLKTFRINPGTDNQYVHVPTVTIQDCPNLETISITNCINKLDSDQGILRITGCENLKDIDLTRSKFSSIIWDKAKPDEIDRLSLNSLILNESTVSTIKESTEGVDGIIDLTEIEAISNFSMNYDVFAKYVKFDNIEESPFDIKKDSAFFSCTSLKRVYGNITLSSSNAFNNCTEFSVLGGDYYGTENMVINSSDPSTMIVRHFYDADLRDTLVGSDGKPIFLSGEQATNIKLVGANSGANAFRGTSCSTLDSYYILFNLEPSVTNINGIFYQCSKIVWTWVNSPSRYTFKNCGSIVNAGQAFRNITATGYRLFSPTTDSEGNFNNDGFFSGLTNCTNISALLLGTSNYVIDRNLFRRTGSNYSLQNMDYFYPRFVVDDVESYQTLESLISKFSLESLKNDAETGDWKYGNLGGFFINLVNLTSINGIFNGLSYINYEAFEGSPLRIPTGVKNLRLAFRTVYSYGTISDFSSIFETTGYSYLTQGIYSSFINLDPDPSLRATLKITDTLFHGFDNLLGVGYYNDSSDFNSSERSFSGLNKIIKQEGFPYDIVPNKSNITRFQGVFEDAKFDDEYTPSEPIELPGRMFEGCNNLISVSYLFNNFNNDYSLTSESFKDCVKLSEVSRIFSCDASNTDTRRRNYLNGSIPNKLFYHGEREETISVRGLKDSDFRAKTDPSETLGITILSIVGNVATGTLTESLENDHKLEHSYTFGGFILGEQTNQIFLTPTTNVVDNQTEYYMDSYEDPDTGEIIVKKIIVTTKTERYQFGSKLSLLDTDTIRITYNVPNATIQNMVSVFRGANISEYQHETYSEEEEETLSTYQPFKYVVNNNGRWEEKTPSLKKKTLMWVYDGNYSRYSGYLGNREEDFDYLDDTTVNIGGTVWYAKVGDKEAGTNSGYFCCAPDLFRYCTPNASIRETFAYCGQINGHSETYNQLFNLLGADCIKYGLHGRIVPYLFKPVPRVEDLSGMFIGCKLLGWYSDGDQNYTIPQSLFSYITSYSLNLSSMFLGSHFPEKISLDVFKGTTRLLNVSNIFRYACYDSTSSNWISVRGIFNDNRLSITGLNSAFRVSSSDTEDDQGEPIAMIRDVYVNFLENFKNGYYPVGDAKFIYDGYRTGTVNFGDNKELPTDDGNRNYRTVG